jgi:hypothetical protein
MTSCVASASTSMFLPVRRVSLPAQRTPSRSLAPADTTSAIMRRLQWRHSDPHQDPALVSRQTGQGAGLVTPILAANTLLPTTRPVRRRSVALPGNTELIWLKAGPGSRRGSRPVPIRPLLPERSAAPRGAPVVDTHHRRTTRKTLSSENYRGKHHMQLFHHLSTGAQATPRELTPAANSTRLKCGPSSTHRNQADSATR